MSELPMATDTVSDDESGSDVSSDQSIQSFFVKTHIFYNVLSRECVCVGGVHMQARWLEFLVSLNGRASCFHLSARQSYRCCVIAL